MNPGRYGEKGGEEADIDQTSIPGKWHGKLVAARRKVYCGVLPVVKVGEKHDPAEEEGDQHEEAIHHINQAVLQPNWIKRQS